MAAEAAEAATEALCEMPCAIVEISPTVVAIAMAMPVMPKRLPRIEVVGCERPFKAWIKQTDAIR